MKSFTIFTTAFLFMLHLCLGMEGRIAGEFRGVFTQDDLKYAVTLSHDSPKDLKKNERIRYHMTLEQGCQVYTGTALYTPGRILIMAESIYLVEGSEEVGLDHFDLLQLQCDVDPNGIITQVRLILPDGKLHAMNHDASTAASQEENAAIQTSGGLPATVPDSKNESLKQPKSESEGLIK